VASLTWKIYRRTLRALENNLLSGIHGPKRREDGANCMRRFFNRCYGDKIKKDEMGWTMRSAYETWAANPEGKRPHGSIILKWNLRVWNWFKWFMTEWEDNIKMNLGEIGIDGANWIRLARNRVQWRPFVNTVMNLRVP
jgi:hypothetical protein